MKKVCLLPLLALFANSMGNPTPLAAQRVGLVGARTNFDLIVFSRGFTPQSSAQDRTGYAAGVSYRRRISPHTVFQPELLYVPKGVGTATQPRQALGYVELPLLLRLGAVGDAGAALRPVFVLGPARAPLTTRNSTFYIMGHIIPQRWGR